MLPFCRKLLELTDSGPDFGQIWTNRTGRSEQSSSKLLKRLERVRRIELPSEAWEAYISTLILNDFFDYTLRFSVLVLRHRSLDRGYPRLRPLTTLLIPDAPEEIKRVLRAAFSV
jgi:hypothetical protein